MSERPYRITVVCHGNICRSPMAAFLLREAFTDAGLDGLVEVDSAGTSTEELGNPAHPRTIATLRRHGHPDVGWADHRARQFRADWFDDVDLVLAADHPHADRLERLARDADERGRIRLLRSFDPEAAAAGELGMDDPWYGGDAEYEQTYAEIGAAVPGIVEHVRRALDA
ncbi:low molecular weight protein-tyrosine-phosphatase [uncultured Phycicoccus sp.]|uniref:low molecular weight protein-tyrosine-phosphatase n=1 Tax=uncultured Phycicoccus sp. TaxID=661422 RepID=UPI00262F2C9A|nr:low molecular weight protein-tyrosine-phosphatase [uncultured Phycicoccus sp.]